MARSLLLDRASDVPRRRGEICREPLLDSAAMADRDRRAAGIRGARMVPAALGLAGALFAQTASNDWTIDTARSRLTVNVLPAGLLSSALHPHHFEPDEWSGEIAREPDHPGAVKVEVRIAAGSLHDHQPKLSAKDIAKVERRVQSPEVLDSARYPKIVFEAREFQPAQAPSDGSGDFRGTLAGTLTLHGKARSLQIPVQGRLTGERLEASGAASFRQSDFGIEPYRAALGTVAVRDEITIEIALVAVPRGRNASAAARAR